jgi:hypothetical protein
VTTFAAACATVAAHLSAEGSDLVVDPSGWQTPGAWVVGAYAADPTRLPGARLFVVDRVSGRLATEWAPGPMTMDAVAKMRRAHLDDEEPPSS